MPVVLTAPIPNDPEGTNGVDMLSHPRILGSAKASSAVNLIFENGVIRTRYGFNYNALGLRGQVQGAAFYSPSKGLSAGVFASEVSALVIAIGGRMYLGATEGGELSCPARPLCGDYTFCGQGNVEIFSAENWLIAQNINSQTVIWDGMDCARVSPGMADVEEQEALKCPTLTPEELEDKTGNNDPKASIMKRFKDSCGDAPESSHDSFRIENRKNWLVNGAQLGAYAHGRIHQQNPFAIFVGDIVHKGGYKSTDDVVSMEEQALPSYGDPLTWNSDLGRMMAFKMLNESGTANGQGDLIGYYENGVVSFNTFQFPRETRSDIDESTGRVVKITEGWESKRMVSRLLEIVSAVGRYAVAALPQDHLFRSRFGIHFLKSVLGQGSFRTEQINSISQPVQPLLDCDNREWLHGSACGVWYAGARFFTTVGMDCDECVSSAPFGRGFVSFNQATRFTQDRTPIPSWEGLWLPDSSIAGIHSFHDLDDRATEASFGFLCLTDKQKPLFAYIDKDLHSDLTCEGEIPIEWSIETAQFRPTRDQAFGKIQDGTLEFQTNEHSQCVRVLVRTDLTKEWQEWALLEFNEEEEGTFKDTQTLGDVTAKVGEASWFQFRLEGLGYFELERFYVEFSKTKTKTGERKHRMVTSDPEDLFITNESPATERWDKK